MLRFFRQGRSIALLVFVAILTLRTFDPPFMQVLRMRSFDIVQGLFPREASDPPVVIVDIDDPSLRELGQWPWPRTMLADLVDRLAAMGAAVIGFDVMFSEPDRTSPKGLSASLQGLDVQTREMLASLPDHDERFAESLADAKVVLGISGSNFTYDKATPPKSPPAKVGGDPAPFLLRYTGVVRPVEQLEQAAAGVGMLTMRPEGDAVVRRVPLVVAAGGTVFSTLSFEMLRVVLNRNAAIRTVGDGISDVLIGDYDIPTDSRGRIWVNYAQHDRTKLYIPVKEFFRGDVDPNRIRNKMVLIGTSATGLGDIKATPINSALPGVEIHAQIIETVLGGTYLLHPDWAGGAELGLIFVTGMLMIWLVPRAGARLTLAVLSAVSIIIATGTIYLFVQQSILLDGALPLITAGLLYTFLVTASYSREEAQRRQIRSAFGQYLSPDLVEHLANNPTALRLGGQRQNMTFLFTDIRGFTSVAELYRDNPEGLTTLINRFMTPMSNSILRRRGTIDKYMGDAIMAFWNAPLPDPQHPVHACEGALDMLDDLKHLNDKLHEEGNTLSLNIGIGINTGDCIVGNMGSDLRFDYSVLGDAVNLAARLEGQSKHYGVAIVIGEDTYKFVKEWATIELDSIVVKGKREAAHIYTLLGKADMAATDDYQALRDEHDAMLRAYRRQDWPEAKRRITNCRRLTPHLEALYDVYEHRIAEYEYEPPPPEWDGVFVASEK